MLKTVLIIALATSLTVLTAQHLRRVDTQFSQQLLQGSEQAETIHVFTKLSLTNTNESGTAKSLVNSPYTRYIVSQQETQLESPHMLVYRDQQSPVKLTAESAIIDHQANTTTLQKNVNVSIDEDKNKPLRMTTDLLLIDNIKRVATTQSAASIYYGSSRMNGTGLEFDLDQKKIKFLDKVHGIYEH